MPKCRECGNTREFLSAWIEFEVSVFDETGKCVDNWAGSRERLDSDYPLECRTCTSTDIEGEI
jgi:hypothetical protein